MKRTVVFLFLIVGSSASSGQLFQSEDIHRPLVSTRLPKLEDFEAIFPGKSRKELQIHRRLLKTGWSVFSVRNRDEWGQGLYIKRLTRAVKGVDEDPYAWSLLAAYYALGHELGAATEANLQALDRIRRLETKLGAGAFLSDLTYRCQANLSRLWLAQDEPVKALDALGEHLPEEVSPVVRNAMITAGVLSFLEAGQNAAASRLLKGGEGRQEAESGEFTEAAAYPQFGSRWTDETLPYLQARRDFAEGKYAAVVRALAPFDRPDAKLWDARLLRGLALWKDGRLKEGIATLESLERDMPRTLFTRRLKGKILRPELVLYNLGLLREQAGESPESVRSAYLSALDLAVSRDCRAFNELWEVDGSERCDLKRICGSLEKQATFLAEERGLKVEADCARTCVLAEKRSGAADGLGETLLCQAIDFETFDAAFNNLGLSYLRQAQQPAGSPMAEPAALLQKAEEAFSAGLVGTVPERQWRLRLNLILVEIERSEFGAAIAESRKMEGEYADKKPELAALLSDALRKFERLRRDESALALFLDLASSLAGPDLPDYLTAVLEPIADEEREWTHVPEAYRARALGLLPKGK